MISKAGANGAGFYFKNKTDNKHLQTKINYLEFSCKNIEAIKSFYSKAFGWSFVDYGPEYVAFNDGNLDGGFFIDEQHSPAINPLVVLYAANLEAAQELVKQHGGKITKAIFAFPGGRRFHFADPDGNTLAIWSE